jgi:O-antigen ligase
MRSQRITTVAISDNAPQPALRELLPHESGRLLQDEPLPLWVGSLALFSIVLARTPILVPHYSSIYRVALALSFVTGAIWAFPRRNRKRISKGTVRLLALYLFIVGVAMVRGADVGVYSAHSAVLDWLVLGGLALFGVTFCASAQTGRSLSTRLALVAYSPAAYVAANVFLRATRHSLPFSLPVAPTDVQGTTDELLGLVGIHAARISFPLALGVNNFGAIAGAGFAAAVLLGLRTRRPPRILSALAAVLCLYGVLATDSRAPLFLALAVILLFIVRKRIRAAKGLAVIVPLSPVLLLAGLSFVSGSGFLGRLSRQSGDLSTGNNRLYIWRAVFGVIGQANGHLIFGYGGFGQVKSGVAYQYAYIFGDSLASQSHSAHNIALQTVLDSGYSGLFVLVAVVIAALRVLERSLRVTPQSAVQAAMALLLVTILSGATEALPSYLFPDTLALFVFVLAAAGGSRLTEPGEEAPPADAARRGDRTTGK